MSRTMFVISEAVSNCSVSEKEMTKLIFFRRTHSIVVIVIGITVIIIIKN